MFTGKDYPTIEYQELQGYFTFRLYTNETVFIRNKLKPQADLDIGSWYCRQMQLIRKHLEKYENDITLISKH